MVSNSIALGDTLYFDGTTIIGTGTEADMIRVNPDSISIAEADPIALDSINNNLRPDINTALAQSSIWDYDVANGRIYPTDLTDKLLIGTATPSGAGREDIYFKTTV